MNKHLQFYKNLRAYRHLSFFSLINQILCNRILKNQFLVSVSPNIYKAALRFPGKIITNYIMGNTICKLFSSGQNIEELNKASQHLANQGIPLIIDVCTVNNRINPKLEVTYDKNAENYALSVKYAGQRINHIISLKLTALINSPLLKKYNDSILLRNKIWRQYSVDGKINSQQLLQAFQSIYLGTNEQHLQNYLRNIHNFAGSDIAEFSIDELTFKMNHHSYYIYEPEKNSELIVNICCPLDRIEKTQMANFIRRLNEILEPQHNNPNNTRIIVDAEQTYVQSAIQSVTQQLQAKYNQQKAYIINTLQSYLNESNNRLQLQIELAKCRQLFLGIKLVRGDYYQEETSLRKNKNDGDTILSFQQASDNYLRNFGRLVTLKNMEGEIFVAGHQNINALLEIKKKAETGITINFAQLSGFGDHLAQFLKNERQTVYAQISWAQSSVMAANLMDRAPQLSQMRYPLDTQYSLLKHELFFRTLSA